MGKTFPNYCCFSSSLSHLSVNVRGASGAGLWCDASREGGAVKVATGVLGRCEWGHLRSKIVNATGLCLCSTQHLQPPNLLPPRPLLPSPPHTWVRVAVYCLMFRQQENTELDAVPAAWALAEQGRPHPAATSAWQNENHKFFCIATKFSHHFIFFPFS